MNDTEIIRKAAETIQRLGSSAQDCKSCARLTLCNAYQDGDSFHGCDYKWIHADDAYGLPFNQWISVDDKLPEWDKTVLVWYASDTLFGVSEGYGLSWYHGSWRLNDLNGENIRIFYWQYLPEKPKRDGDTK